MNNYIPTALPGALEHLRYYQFFLSRPYGDDLGQPVINFREERIVEDVNGKQTERRGEISSSISDENEDTSFDIINPGTLQPTGSTMTYAELLQGIDSLYYHFAVQRDASQIPPP